VNEPIPRADRPDPELPDPALVWRFVGQAARPIVGWVLAGLGLLAIFLGWFGVSGQALVAKQLPYLISGGVGGMALVGLGAVLIGTEQLRRDARRLDRLERMVGELHSVLLSRPDAPQAAAEDAGHAGQSAMNGARGGRRRLAASSPAGSAASARSADHATGLVALPSGTTFHVGSCVMVRDKAEAAPVDEAAVRRRGLEPCRVCEPTLLPA
jgi:hypothetical protein